MVYGSCWAPINSIPYAIGQVTLIYEKSWTTDEAHQAKRALFSFFPIGHARVRSMGVNLGVQLGLESVSKRDKFVVHWSNTHFLYQSLIIKLIYHWILRLKSFPTVYRTTNSDGRVKSYGHMKICPISVQILSWRRTQLVIKPNPGCEI